MVRVENYDPEARINRGKSARSGQPSKNVAPTIAMRVRANTRTTIVMPNTSSSRKINTGTYRLHTQDALKSVRKRASRVTNIFDHINTVSLSPRDHAPRPWQKHNTSQSLCPGPSPVTTEVPAPWQVPGAKHWWSTTFRRKIDGMYCSTNGFTMIPSYGRRCIWRGNNLLTKHERKLEAIHYRPHFIHLHRRTRRRIRLWHTFCRGRLLRRCDKVCWDFRLLMASF